MSLPATPTRSMIHPTSMEHRSFGRPLPEHESSVLPLQTVLVVFLVHVPLAFLMSMSPTVAGLHAYATLLLGVAWAASNVPLHRVTYVVAYIAGAEVLWRITDAPVLWEFGKYAAILILILAIQRSRPLKSTAFTIMFCALLVPSILLTVAENTSMWNLKWDLSFNLSGPLALAVCAAFFCRVQLTAVRALRMLIAFLAPVIGLVTVILFRLSQVENLVFRTNSNPQTSGGSVPVHVSMVLGFGALAALLIGILLLPSKQRGFRWLMVGLAVWLAAQSAFTFSRSGLYLAAGGALAGAVVMLRDARLRITVLVTACSVYLIGAYVVAPRLNAYTGGALSRRFSEEVTASRERIMQADIQLWMEHPLFGVGPGRSSWHRIALLGNRYVAHSEFTRLLAEHGMLGFAALVILGVSTWQAWRRITSRQWKAFVASTLAFSLLCMMSNATRIVLPAFALGLVFAALKNEYIGCSYRDHSWRRKCGPPGI